MLFRVSQISGGSGSGASLVVTCSSDFAGLTITASKSGSASKTQTCPSTSPYVVTFSGLENGTWTISGTVDGQTYSVNATISDFTASLYSGLNWQAWVDASVDLDSSDYQDLDEVLADEKAVRELMLVHDCVDILASVVAADANVTKILNNDLCAKWINLSDYALDTLYANAALATVMATADKYFYGEWVITDNTTTPATWGPKGAVPVMTSANSPYCEISADSTYSGHNAYYPFADMTHDNNGDWLSNGSTGVLKVKFTNPICPKKVIFSNRIYTGNSDGRTETFKIQGSNDGTNWTDLTQVINRGSSADASGYVTEVDLSDNTNYYLYLAFNGLSSFGTRVGLGTLQFYGRQMSVSVPVMTGNTTPFGEAVYSSSFGAQYLPYYAFDNSDSTCWYPQQNTGEGEYVGFKFDTDVVVKKCIVKEYCQQATSVKIQRKNGSTLTDISEDTAMLTGGTTVTTKDIPITNTESANEYHLVWTSGTADANGAHMMLANLQFYGFDYSEKEFEQGTMRKWIYDHGVELETLTAYEKTTNDHVVKNSDDIYLESVANGAAEIHTAAFDLTDYDLLRIKIGNVCSSSQSGATSYGSYGVADSTPAATSASYVGKKDITATDLPNNSGLDISSYDVTKSIAYYQASSSYIYKCKIVELWASA